jgi:hypothetical protein
VGFLLVCLPLFTLSLVVVLMVERWVLAHAPRLRGWLGLA